MSWGSTSSVWANTIVATTPFLRPRSCLRRSQAAPVRSALAPPSPCSVPTTRSACFSVSQPWTPRPNGRAEIIFGRGSFTESFPLFGYELSQYEKLFEEKLELFSVLIKQEPVTWHGNTRAPLTNQRVFPKTESALKTCIGVGGSPEAVVPPN